MTSSNWVKDLMVNSSESELKQRVDKRFKKLKSLKHGGITYLKFMLDEMFYMTNNVMAALQTFFKNFAEEVSRRRYERMCRRFWHRLKR